MRPAGPRCQVHCDPARPERHPRWSRSTGCELPQPAMGRGGRRWRLGSFTRRPRARAARPTNRRCAAATATAGSPPQSHTRGHRPEPRGRLAWSSPLPAPLPFFLSFPFLSFPFPPRFGAIPDDPCGYTRHGEFDSDREAFVVEGEERQLTAWDFFYCARRPRTSSSRPASSRQSCWRSVLGAVV